jgi:hypothetical protein
VVSLEEAQPPAAQPLGEPETEVWVRHVLERGEDRIWTVPPAATVSRSGPYLRLVLPTSDRASSLDEKHWVGKK